MELILFIRQRLFGDFIYFLYFSFVLSLVVVAITFDVVLFSKWQ